MTKNIDNKKIIKLFYYIKVCIIVVHDNIILKAFQIPTMSLIMSEFNS